MSRRAGRKKYTNVARAADVLDYFLSRDTNERARATLAQLAMVTLPDESNVSSQAAAYERGLRLRGTSRTHPLSPYAVEAYANARKKSGILEPRNPLITTEHNAN